jgi:hypothetical protein
MPNRSFYLNSRENDFTDLPEGASRLGFDDIFFVEPANDNRPFRDGTFPLSRRLIHRVIANLAAIARLGQTA